MERWILKLERPAGYAALALGLVSMGCIFFYAPLEQIQGLIQKIFYIHVNFAILSYLSFSLTAVGGALFLWSGDEQYDRIARSSAEVGVLFCSLVLITGPIWARPVWGTWWTWEARLVLTLILWFIYVAYLLLRRFTEGEGAAARFSAVLGIFGVGTIPFLRVAVERFRGQHPGNPFKAGLPFDMALTFYLTMTFFLCLLVYLLARRLKLLHLSNEVKGLQLAEM